MSIRQKSKTIAAARHGMAGLKPDFKVTEDLKLDITGRHIGDINEPAPIARTGT